MQDPRKILVIRLSSIGDIVLASPLLRVLRKNYPAARIDFAVKSQYAELVRFSHHLSSVLELKNSDRRDLRRLRNEIRKERYDVVLDLHNNWRSKYLRMRSGARHVSVVNKRVAARFLLIRFKWNLYRNAVPVAQRYFETASALGVEDDNKGLEIFIPDETLFSVSSMMGKLRLDRYESVVGIAPAAKHNTKMWPADRFVAVAVERIRQHNAKVLILGGPDDVQRCDEITGAVNTAGGTEGAVNFCGKLTLLETAAALDSCDVVLCNDSGIMHLAAARQRNVVAVFGPTVREFGFFPYGTNSTVLEQAGLSCRPCTHLGSATCPEGHFRCMLDTTVENVSAAVNATLAKYQTPA